MDDQERLLNPIPTRELERRWKAVREAMAERGIDALVLQNNNEFLGGYVKWFTDTPGKNAYPLSVLFPREGRMTLVGMGPFGGEREIAESDATHRGVAKFLTTPAFAAADYSKHYDAELIGAELKRRSPNTVGLVGTAGMSHAFCDFLKGQNPAGAVFVDATEMVDGIKAVKSEDEMERLRQTAAMQDQIIAEVGRAIKPGMRDFEVTALAQYLGQQKGSEQGIFLGTSAPQGSPSRFAQRHFQGRQLKEGDHLVLLVENNGFGGFYTEISRTFVLGKAGAQLSEAFDQACEASAHTLKNLLPGAPCGEVFEAHNDFMRSRGLPQERRIFAHGQGYDMVERPLIRDDETMAIAANMNIAVHPAIPTDEMFVTVCDNYLIGPNGPEASLHKTPQKIFEI